MKKLKILTLFLIATLFLTVQAWSATIILMPKFHAEYLGEPVSGGLLYSYVAGTSTAKDTYTDRAAGTPNANPVVLDSNGDATVYGSGSYKLKLYTDPDGDGVGDTLIWTMDNLKGMNETAFTTIGDYNDDFDAAITSIGATEMTLYVDDTGTMSTAVTIPATLTVIVLEGGKIDQGGYALTVDGKIIMSGGEIEQDVLTFNSGSTLEVNGLYQAFTGSVTPTINTGVISVVYPQWFGAVEGTGNDCATAIQRCIDAGPATGYAIKITHGVWEFQSQLDFGTKAHSVIGDGWGSVLYVNIDASTDAIVVGSTSESSSGWLMRDLMILGDTNCCQYGIYLKRAHHTKIKNVVLLMGAAEYAIYGWGSLYADWELYINPVSSGTQPTWVKPANGIKFESIISPVTLAVNINKIRVHIETIAGNGVYLDGSAAEANVIDLSGTIEGITGYPIYANNIRHLHVHDLYMSSGGSTYEDCKFLKLGPGYKAIGAGLKEYLINSNNVTIDGASFGRLNIDSDCDAVVLGQVDFANENPVEDSGKNTRYIGPITIDNIARDPLMDMHIAQDWQNYCYNSSFERWQSDRPDSWSKPAVLTWAKESTIVNNTTYSAKATMSSASSSDWTNPDATIFLEKAKGKYITFIIYTYVATGQSPTVNPRVRLQVVSAGSGDLDHYAEAFCYPDHDVRDVWIRQHVSAYVPTDSTAINIRLYGDDTFYIAEPCLMIGTHGQYGWVQEHNEHNEYAIIGGHKLLWGAAAPASGWHQVGDVCFNTAPTAGTATDVGWACTASGTPGTWKGFGDVAS